MEGDLVESPSDCSLDMSSFHDFASAGSYVYDAGSTDSSPSPHVIFSNLELMPYNGFPFPPPTVYPTFDTTVPPPIVEFTDLTAPYQDDRRRKRSHAIKDKQTISTMHMRRRAQNRASQRAFRERKEKHAQDLQCQLDELEGKHKALLASYQQLDSTNTKLIQELEELRAKIGDINSSRSEAFNELPSSDSYDLLAFESNMEENAVASHVKP